MSNPNEYALVDDFLLTTVAHVRSRINYTDRTMVQEKLGFKPYLWRTIIYCAWLNY